MKIDGLTPVAAGFVEAVAGRVAAAELPERLAKMALVFKGREQTKDARRLAETARELAPDDFRIRVLTDWLTRRQAPLWHFRIIHDQLRNEVYAKALQRFVQPGMVVFEIGTGTGILAMLAAQAGAEHVYTCERRPDVAEAAREIIRRNGFADRITVIAKDAYALQPGVDVPVKADLFVAEIVDNSLLGEGVLPLTDLAREKFLKPDAILLPHSVSAMGYLMGGNTAHRQSYRMEQAMGFDLTPFNRFTPIQINVGRGGGDVNPLSPAVELMRFDLRQSTPKEGREVVTLTADADCRVESLLRWLHLDFGDGIVFENRPPQESGWDPHLHVFPSVQPLRAGESMQIEISHDRDQLFIVPLYPQGRMS